jgi:hypothetical protein
MIPIPRPYLSHGACQSCGRAHDGRCAYAVPIAAGPVLEHDAFEQIERDRIIYGPGNRITIATPVREPKPTRR